MKIGIVGAGFVGGSIADALMNKNGIHEIVLIDHTPKKAMAQAMDIMDAVPFSSDININAGDYKDLHDAEIVVITAGVNQKSGETRLQLVSKNIKIMKSIIPEVMKFAPKNVILVIVSNPLDVMVMLATKLSKLPANRVIGTGTMLDTARFQVYLSKKLNVSPQVIDAFVLGEHGDSSVLNWESVNVSCLDLANYCEQMNIPFTATNKKTIEQRVRGCAQTIIEGKGATWYGVGYACASLIQTIINDEHKLYTTSSVSNEILGKPIAFSLPRIIGRIGVENTLIPVLSKNELKDLKHSGKIILDYFNKHK